MCVEKSQGHSLTGLCPTIKPTICASEGIWDFPWDWPADNHMDDLIIRVINAASVSNE